MKKIFPALLGGVSAGVAAWLALDLGLSHWAAAISGAIGAFLGVAVARAMSYGSNPLRSLGLDGDTEAYWPKSDTHR